MRSVRAACVLALLVGLSAGCAVDAPAHTWSQGLAQVQVQPDALLVRARQSLHAGHIDPAALAQLRASGTPAHRRAVRVLDVMAAPRPSAPAPAEADDAALTAPRIKLATAPPQPATTAPSRARSTTKAVATAAPSRPVAARRATLQGLGLSKTQRGAALSLRGSGGLVVGVASQPSSGIVRLVMDAEASTSALRSRPKVTGARVTGIRRTGKSVFVTLSLDPGWSLRGIVKTRSGARVDLRRPA
ncbi:MAG: hypothetical protein AAGA54_10740 [Myxococcota bacterium]